MDLLHAIIVEVQQTDYHQEQKSILGGKILSKQASFFVMLDQQIESVSSKLVQFVEDLTLNIQTIGRSQSNFNQSFIELFQLRSDYAKQLAALFDMLIRQLIEQFLPNRTVELTIRLDPVQQWRFIQNCTDQLNELQWQDLSFVIKHIRTINNYFYNLLLQVKNAEFLKVDQTRSLSQCLTDELYHLSESLIHFSTIGYIHSQKTDQEMKLPEVPQPTDTYLFQNTSTTQYSSNNNHLHEPTPSLSSTEKPTQPAAMNSNCYPRNTPNNAFPYQSYWSNQSRGCCYQPTPVRCTTDTTPMTGVFPCSKPMGCGYSSRKNETPPPLCFPTPVVYTPEMETLSSSGGIIYARKSGNTWIAENLGTLIETLKDIGQTIDMNAHCEILVRKTGELLVRRKKGRRKHFLQQNLTKSTPRGNDAYAEANITREQSDSNVSNDDQ